MYRRCFIKETKRADLALRGVWFLVLPWQTKSAYNERWCSIKYALSFYPIWYRVNTGMDAVEYTLT